MSSTHSSANKNKEQEQEKILLEKINQVLLSKTENLERAKEELEKKLASQTHKAKELEQEQVLLNNLNAIMESRLEDVKPTNANPNLTIDRLLAIHKEISVFRLAEFSKIEESEVLSHLEDLESQGKATRLDERKEMTCRDCPSVNLEISFHCPKCRNSHYVQDKIIEHFACGNVSAQDSYSDDKCPKCRKTIKVFGVDYRVSDWFVCDSCHDKFQEPMFMLKCNNCNATFSRESVNWKSSPRFRLKS